MEKDKILQILSSEMELATGCTEPAAIALTAATASRHLKEPIERITVLASGNIIKNAMAAGIPGTPYTGIDYAAAIGATGGDLDRQLQVINDVSAKAYHEAENLVTAQKVSIDIADVEEKLYIDITIYGAVHTARTIISGTHTNIILIEENGTPVFQNKNSGMGASGVSPENIQQTLSIQKIYNYITDMDTVNETPEIILQSIKINTEIAEEGLKNDYGLKIGKILQDNKIKGIIGDDMITNAMMMATAGADARMAGAPLTVVSNSGSGNQGITATMPVVAVAKWLKATDDKMIRAVTLSNLIAIYIKSKFGRLSALCGATVAATGASCGVTYLLGGGFKEIEYAIQSMVGDVTGMLCDGAKADCSLKICTCTNAAMQAALMAVRGIRVQSTDGIVENDVEKTIDNFTTLGNKGSVHTDKLVLRMMLDKSKP